MSASSSENARFSRSGESVGFEGMWRGLPRIALLPERRTFQPRLAKQFLRNLLVVQAATEDDPTLLIRIAGDAIGQPALGNIVGQDFLDFVPEAERKTRVLDIARTMFSQPCGVWWVAPVHYERGYSRFWELTAFPLEGDGQIRAAILVYALPLDLAPDSRATGQRAIHVDVAAQMEPIALEATS